MTRIFEDALGRRVGTTVPPVRIVSLVPSDTELVATLVGLERLVGRTVFCEAPAGRVERVPTVGGTKRFDVDAVLALRPDLVLANQEENGRRDVEALVEAGLSVFVALPTTVRQARAHVETVAGLLHAIEAATPALEALDACLTRAVEAPRATALVAIWKDPWMSVDGRTYASDVLRHAGLENVFAARARRYPLAADLGTADAAPAEGRDTRYPRVSLDEVRAADPDLVLLPDEPYAFDDGDVATLEALGFAGRVVRVSGKDLFWPGPRAVDAIVRLRGLGPRR